jgi:MoaA/NifB/PqqE/SkfB family radical SAM enzyme
MRRLSYRAWLSTLGARNYGLPVVIFYVTEGCNLQCTMCSYREALAGELSLQEIKKLAGDLAGCGLQHIVFSGGEPLLRKDFPEICSIFASRGIKETMLTNGLLLNKRFEDIAGFFSEIIVSMDGATSATHDSIRGVRSFDTICEGIVRVRKSAPGQSIAIRTVIQKKNFREIGAMIGLAKSLGAKRISFLAADALSEAFGRERAGKPDGAPSFMLSKEETAEFREVVDSICSTHAADFESKFISESPAKLYHLAEYFEAFNGMREYPRVLCNAPNVSAVIDSTGNILPCFFLPAFGNVQSAEIDTLLNNELARTTRDGVSAGAVERCKTCVCSLYVSPMRALTTGF